MNVVRHATYAVKYASFVFQECPYIIIEFFLVEDWDDRHALFCAKDNMVK